MDLKSGGPEPLAYSINDACRVTSIGRTRLYELIAEGKLSTVSVGRRRLVKAESVRKLLEAA